MAALPTGKWSYIAVLAFIVVGSVWLEVVVHTRVYTRWRRLVASLIPGLVLFSAWDVYAIRSGHWWFDESAITGVRLPGNLPLDEVLFFLIVPVAAILTLEAVRAVKRWQVGDEPPGSVSGGVRVEDR